jgi:hypothetical protein
MFFPLRIFFEGGAGFSIKNNGSILLSSLESFGFYLNNKLLIENGTGKYLDYVKKTNEPSVNTIVVIMGGEHKFSALFFIRLSFEYNTLSKIVKK